MKKIYKNTILSVYENQDNVANPTFLKCKINILDTSSIANHTHFKKENVNKSIYQLDYLPVRGLYKEDEEEFGGHEISYYIDDEGNLKESVGTVPMGVVIKNSARWENINNKETLVCDCYIWTNNNEGATRRIKENSVSQSMEIIVDNYSETNKDYIEIEGFTFTSLTLIDTQPAFDCGSIRTYSQNDFKVDYQKMMTALDKFLNFEEGGEIVEDNKEILEEAVENNVEEVVETVSEDNKEETFEAEQEEVVEDVENNEEKVEEETTIDYSVEFESLQAKYSELETSKNELNIKYEALMEEVCELREYKATKEKEYREAKERELFARFETLKDEERFVKLVENKANYSLEELEEKCYAIKGMVAEAKESKKSKKVENTPLIDKVYSANLEDNTIGKYDAFIKKYSKNN